MNTLLIQAKRKPRSASVNSSEARVSTCSIPSIPESIAVIFQNLCLSFAFEPTVFQYQLIFDLRNTFLSEPRQVYL